MRYVPMNLAEPGMALGQELYDGDGQLLVARHLILDKDYIKALSELGFPGVYIDDEFTEGIRIQEVVSPEVRREAIRGVRELFISNAYDEDAAEEEARIKKLVLDVIEDILSNGDVMYNMLDLKVYDDYTYFHSVNVAVLSVMMGSQMCMTRQELTILATAAILHDIGKKFLSLELLNTPKLLGAKEKQLLLDHPRLGFEFLKQHFHFPSMVCLSVLEHHEWYNGEGYPLHKAGNDISIYARIIKLADTVDAMGSKRPYHEPAQPSEIVEYIMGRMGSEFDPNVVITFLNKIVAYPVGCEVELSNGQHAVVMENYSDFVLRPKIKILETEKVVDLMQDEKARNITITKLLI